MGSPLAISTPGKFQYIYGIWRTGILHATHRLFMSNNILTCYLESQPIISMKVKNRDNLITLLAIGKQISIIFHPKILRLCSKQVKKQADRTDDLHYKLNEDKNDQKSIRRFENDIDVLKEGILEHLTNFSYIGELSPKVYDDISQALRKRKGHISVMQNTKNYARQMTVPPQIMTDDAQKEH
jgi:hypothetical protein